MCGLIYLTTPLPILATAVIGSLNNVGNISMIPLADLNMSFALFGMIVLTV